MQLSLKPSGTRVRIVLRVPETGARRYAGMQGEVQHYLGDGRVRVRLYRDWSGALVTLHPLNVERI